MLDRTRTIEAAAAGNGASLIVFSATYVLRYPSWIRRLHPVSDAPLGTLQHIAREGFCWVLASDFPDEWPNGGYSVVIAPGGKIVAGPLRREVGIRCADIDTAAVAAARRTLHVVGHYARHDVFKLHVNDRVPVPAEAGGAPKGEGSL